MKNSRDANGQAMVAYFQGENPIEIYGRDDMCIAARCGSSRRPQRGTAAAKQEKNGVYPHMIADKRR